MPAPDGVTFRRFDSVTAAAARETVLAIYEASYVDAIASGDPFNFAERFMHRFDRYTECDGFDMVIAYQDDQPIGQAWGWPLGEADKTSGWWFGLRQVPEPGFTDEDGTRTFALSEIMVHRSSTGRGVAHALHDQLLAARPEKRATLLVRPDKVLAYRAYLRWGWTKVNELRPDWPDAPLFDVLIMPLPLSS